MSEIKENSVEYWDKRFRTDWEDFCGSEQTAYFAKVASDLIPQWLVKEIKENQYTYCDIGCATGVGVNIMSKFLGVQGSGMDFSEEAILQAKKNYPQYHFYRQDITQIEKEMTYDIVFCSNVLEHFDEPWKILKGLLKITNQYAILLVPFREELEIKEHVYRFDTNRIPMRVLDFRLIHADTMDGQNKVESYYPGQQILLVYSCKQQQENVVLLEDVTKGIAKSEEVAFLHRIQEEQKKTFLREEEMRKEIRELQMQIREIKEEVKEKEMIIEHAVYQCREMTASRMFRMVHLLNRLVYQGVKGDKKERKNFRSWLLSRKETGGDTNRTYHPLFSIMDILHEKNKEQIQSQGCFLREDQKEILNKEYKNFDIIWLSVIDYDFRYQRPQHLASKFAKNGHRVFYVNANYHRGRETKEVLENLFVINLYHPSISSVYETDGYGNMGMLKDQLKKMMFDFGIRDGIVVVDYPNWVNIAQYFKKLVGFKIVTDYMDDYTGFINGAQEVVKKNSIKLLQISDKVVASSQFLWEIAKKYNDNVEIVRNGTEFVHFHDAARERTQSQDRKVIGYYGAIAHWFDVDKVCYVAKEFHSCDIILIGEVLEGAERLKKFSNIKLLGEKPYGELPHYLKDFDVCMIPFCTNTDLIRATNPVKFYEYLSAGKKIVATEIPELEPFQDAYVYLSNDNKQFANYIKLCLLEQDTLKSMEDAVEFAKRQDWQNRYEAFQNICIRMVPKVSIIVLTYNNMEYNQWCIESILQNTAYPSYELIVVDNASTDGTREYLEKLKERQIPFIKVILNEENHGFAGGNNIGIREAQGKYLVTLNNDTLVTRGWLTSLTKHLEEDKKVGMCGPVTNSIGNEAKIAVSYYNLNTLAQFAYSYTWEHLEERYPEPNVLALFCTMIRREVIEKCGLLDERYEVGMFEDDDYAQAVRKAGYKLLIAEDAFVHHFDGGSFKKLENHKYREIFETNKKKFEEKWDLKWRMQKYRKGVSWDMNSGVMIDMDLCKKSN